MGTPADAHPRRDGARLGAARVGCRRQPRRGGGTQLLTAATSEPRLGGALTQRAVGWQGCAGARRDNHRLSERRIAEAGL